MRQVMLRSDNRELVAWLDESKRLHVGDALTLKNHPEPNRLWSVLAVYGTKDRADIHTDWRVGGLF